MKTKSLFILLIALSSFFAFAQENHSKFNIDFSMKIGGTLIENQNGFSNYHSFSKNFEVGATYDISSKLNACIGAGILETNANYNLNGENNLLSNSFFTIPVKLNLKEYIVEKAYIQSGLGLLNSYHLKNELNGVNNEVKLKNLGWNFSGIAEIGFFYELSHSTHFGIMYEENFAIRKWSNSASLNNSFFKLLLRVKM
jgi:hypothetical protein